MSKHSKKARKAFREATNRVVLAFIPARSREEIEHDIEATREALEWKYSEHLQYELEFLEDELEHFYPEAIEEE